MNTRLAVLWVLCWLVAPSCGDSGPGGGPGDGGPADGSTGADGAPADWIVSVDPSGAGEPVSSALLGHYDLSGALYGYDGVAGLTSAMAEAGFGEWRVGLGRWEAATLVLHQTTDGSQCAAPVPEAYAPAGTTDASLIEARDWFTDDGSPVAEIDTLDDDRYTLAYIRSVLDVVSAFGAEPYVSIDLMPRSLAANKIPFRSEANVVDACMWSFANQVSNSRPADNDVFAAAAAGLVQRVVEGSHGQPGRPVRYWEVWNEPEFCCFWDPLFDNGAYCRDERLEDRLVGFFDMAVPVLLRLDAYRQATAHSDGRSIRIGMGSFALAEVAAAAIEQLDAVQSITVPMDFVSFHAYNHDPLEIVAAVETVAGAVEGSARYRHLELVLAEWGPFLDVPVDAAGMDQPLLMSTVIVLGAAAGLDRAHHAIFWDFYPVLNWGLLDHQVNPRPLQRAYRLMANIITDGAERLTADGLGDGRLDGGLGAVMAARDGSGNVRVLLINRGPAARTARVDLAGVPAVPDTVRAFDDPAADIRISTPSQAVIQVPARSLTLAEFTLQ